jgi:hypothetical protein
LPSSRLLARAAARTDALDLGFARTGVLIAAYDLPRQGYAPLEAARVNREIQTRAARLGGVRTAALTSHVPLTGGLRTTSVWTPESGHELTSPQTRYVLVSSGYFRVLGIPIVVGRDVRTVPGGAPAPDAVVSEIVARRLWPNANPLGMGLRTALTDREYTVVGIARDTRASSLWRDKEAAVYLSANTPEELASMHLVVACADTEAAIARLRRTMLDVEPDLAVEIAPLERAVALWTLPSRLAGALSIGLALMSLLIASVGLYGVLRHLLAQQTRELAIRGALGAGAPALVRHGLEQTVRLVIRVSSLGWGSRRCWHKPLRRFSSTSARRTWRPMQPRRLSPAPPVGSRACFRHTVPHASSRWRRCGQSSDDQRPAAMTLMVDRLPSAVDCIPRDDEMGRGGR